MRPIDVKDVEVADVYKGARLNAVIAATKTSSDDELSLLLAVGEDTVGDVRVVPQGHTPAAPAGILPAKPEEISFLEMFANSQVPYHFQRYCKQTRKRCLVGRRSDHESCRANRF